MCRPVQKLCLAAALSLGLSACAASPGLIAKNSFIDKVQVDVKPEVASSTIGPRVASVVRREATRFGHDGAAKELKITITALHYRNGVTAAVIGDADTIDARVAVVDVANGTKHGEFEAHSIVAPGAGLTGVFLAMMYDKEKADDQLSQGLTRNILKQVYGSQEAEAALSRPVVEPPIGAPSEPPAKPAEKSAPKAAPKAVASPKTAARDEKAMALAQAALPAR